jgi:hypothetical protein
MTHSHLTMIRFAQDITALWDAIVKLNLRFQNKQPNVDGTFPIDSFDGKALDGIIKALDGLSVLANTKDSRVPKAIRVAAGATLRDLDEHMPIGMDRCFEAYRASKHFNPPSLEHILDSPLMSTPVPRIQVGQMPAGIRIYPARLAAPNSDRDDEIPL